ncbi:hypothetical protein [Alterisphingorhabdus coralli]|uniref:Rap1a immunity protein domain-containing protein n=1 Tax=Alterisphingorhabdus coralli TaxID=3071408 RepID=A0AA97HZN9_9SPHN|nr:hypothetical protein [Parasphingorhabdus sp. SCSIO 66989]WOE74929.1 hypothetical protein RB602_13980 [Parasphingorhabdus sp. SCSIO 66989]
MKAIGAIVAASALLMATWVGAQESDPAPTQDEDYYIAPDVGTMCVAALMTTAVTVGEKCFPDQYVENRQALKQTLSLLDAFFLRDPKWNEDVLARFKQRMGNQDAHPEKLCRGDIKALGEVYLQVDQQKLRTSVEELIAASDSPAWGTCL